MISPRAITEETTQKYHKLKISLENIHLLEYNIVKRNRGT